jgi:hypothetical protein
MGELLARKGGRMEAGNHQGEKGKSVWMKKELVIQRY